jgi:hypothetical protein
LLGLPLVLHKRLAGFAVCCFPLGTENDEMAGNRLRRAESDDERAELALAVLAFTHPALQVEVVHIAGRNLTVNNHFKINLETDPIRDEGFDAALSVPALGYAEGAHVPL